MVKITPFDFTVNVMVGAMLRSRLNLYSRRKCHTTRETFICRGDAAFS